MNKSEFLNKMSVRWVIALKEEAKVILDYYEMALINKKIFKKYNGKLQDWSIELDKLKK